MATFLFSDNKKTLFIANLRPEDDHQSNRCNLVFCREFKYLQDDYFDFGRRSSVNFFTAIFEFRQLWRPRSTRNSGQRQKWSMACQLVLMRSKINKQYCSIDCLPFGRYS